MTLFQLDEMEKVLMRYDTELPNLMRTANKLDGM